MNPKLRIPLTVVASIGFLCLLLYLTYQALYPSIVSLVSGVSGTSGLVLLDNTLLVFFLTAALAVLFGVNLNQLLANRIHARFLKVEFGVYLVALFATVFLKSRGVQEVSLDILDFYGQLTFYPASVAMNALLFVPLGAVFHLYMKSFPKALGAFLAAVVLTEAVQYVLSLGIADVVDVAVNTAGLCAGYAAAKLLSDAGWFIERADGGFVRIVRKERRQADLARRTAASIVVAVSVVAVGALGYPLYSQSAESPGPSSLPATTDAILGSLTPKEAGVSELNGYLAAISLPRVNGIEGSPWITVDDEGVLGVSGRVSQAASWLGPADIPYYGLAVGVVEQVDGLKVTHGVPLIVMPLTRIWVDGAQLEASDTAAREAVLMGSYAYDVRASFRLEEGWFKPVDLHFEKRDGEGAEEFHAWFDFSDFAADTERARASAGLISMQAKHQPSKDTLT